MSRRKGDLRGRAATKQLNRIFIRDEAVCQICKLSCLRSEASRDHVIELCAGGSNEDDNIVLTHKICNENKSREHGLMVRQYKLTLDEWWPLMIEREIKACLKRQIISAPITARVHQRFIRDEELKDSFCALDLT